MSRFYDDRASASHGWFGIAALLSAVDQKIVRPLVARHQKRTTYRELTALDDRQLADIGVSRSDLDTVSFAPGRPPSHRV